MQLAVVEDTSCVSRCWVVGRCVTFTPEVKAGDRQLQHSECLGLQTKAVAICSRHRLDGEPPAHRGRATEPSPSARYTEVED